MDFFCIYLVIVDNNIILSSPGNNLRFLVIHTSDLIIACFIAVWIQFYTYKKWRVKMLNKTYFWALPQERSILKNPWSLLIQSSHRSWLCCLKKRSVLYLCREWRKYFLQLDHSNIWLCQRFSKVQSSPLFCITEPRGVLFLCYFEYSKRRNRYSLDH